MSGLLKRSLTPIGDNAWEEIDKQAKRVLEGNLSARAAVDFNGPHGLTKAAVNLGVVHFSQADVKIKELKWGKREVLPLIEFRIPFSLDINDLENLERGLKNPDLDPLDKACFNAAFFEESAIYNGLSEAGIEGIIEMSPHKPIQLPSTSEGIQEALESGIITLQKNRIGGPYHLVVGTQTYQNIQKGDDKGYPLFKRLKGMLRGDIHWSSAVEGGVLLSARGGDYELTVGQDLSIGYLKHDQEKIQLFLTESFIFRVLEPRAAVEFKS